MEIWQDHVKIEGSPSIFLEVRTPWALLFSGILRKFRWFFVCITFNSDFKIFFRCSFTAPPSQIPWMESSNHRIDWWLFDDHLIRGHHRNNIINHIINHLCWETVLSCPWKSMKSQGLCYWVQRQAAEPWGSESNRCVVWLEGTIQNE